MLVLYCVVLVLCLHQTVLIETFCAVRGSLGKSEKNCEVSSRERIFVMFPLELCPLISRAMDI